MLCTWPQRRRGCLSTGHCDAFGQKGHKSRVVLSGVRCVCVWGGESQSFLRLPRGWEQRVRQAEIRSSWPGCEPEQHLSSRLPSLALSLGGGVGVGRGRALSWQTQHKDKGVGGRPRHHCTSKSCIVACGPREGTAQLWSSDWQAQGPGGRTRHPCRGNVMVSRTS